MNRLLVLPLVVALAGCGQSTYFTPPIATVKAIQRVKYDGQQFQDLVAGKTQAQVLELLGQPDDRVRPEPEVELWVYRHLTYNKISGKAYDAGVVDIRGGKVHQAYSTIDDTPRSKRP
ncbi:MAG: hypothetical protein JNM56_32895 [Planctomycetia bacterium]|nr:hypothetical protein [Planctomycetia bacterium]